MSAPKSFFLAPKDDSQDRFLASRVTSRRRPTPYYAPGALRELWQSVDRIEQSLRGSRRLENLGDLDGTETPNSPKTSLLEPDGPSPEVALHRALALDQLCSGSKPIQPDLPERSAPRLYSDLRLETLSPLGKLDSDLAARRAGRIFHLVPNCPSSEEEHETHSAAESSEPLVRFSSLPTSEETSVYTLSNSTELGPLDRLSIDGYCSNTSDDSLDIYSLYGGPHRRSSTRNSSESVDYQPGPISYENQQFDPALQRSLEDYQIKYSRRVYEEPISPKGHELPGPWIYTPPNQFKTFEVGLGSRCKLSFGFHHLPAPNTSRVRHYFYKTRKSVRHHLSVTISLINRLIRRITSLYKRRPKRPQSSLLHFTPMPTPFNSENPLPKIPELHKHLYNVPERAPVVEELPGFLEMSNSALFHHNLLVDIIRFGERPRNLSDYKMWCDFRAEGRKTAGPVPEGDDFSTSPEGSKADGIRCQRTDMGDVGSTF